jgi:hypothetical protein
MIGAAETDPGHRDDWRDRLFFLSHSIVPG